MIPSDQPELKPEGGPSRRAAEDQCAFAPIETINGIEHYAVDAAPRDGCIFCRIVARDAPAYILHEDARIIVFLSLENHPLVVPKRHIPDLYTLDDDTAAAIMRTAVRVARAMKRGLACQGIYLTQANEVAAGQDVFHFHLHLYPRWIGDGMRVIVPARTIAHEEMATRQVQIQAALDADPQT